MANKIVSKFKREIGTVLLSALFFTFMMVIFAPMELYLSNKNYFFFAGTDMLGTVIISFLVVFAVVVVGLLLVLLVNEKAYLVIEGMFVGGTLALYIQGNWDTTNYGAWNGDEIDWSQFRTQRYVFLSIFAILILGFGIWSLIKSNAFGKFARYLAMFIFLIQLSTLGVLLIQKGGLNKPLEYIATTEAEMDFSKNRNMILLIVDSYDSGELNRLLEGDYDKYGTLLEDFTYYPDTVGGYNCTDMSMPLIMTGEYYLNQSTFGEYLDSAYKASVINSWLDDNGWKKEMYTDTYVPQGENGFGYLNCKELRRTVTSGKELMKYIYPMTLFRYVPQPLKDYFYFYADNIRGKVGIIDGGEYDAYSSNNFMFADEISNIAATENENVFKLLHIQGVHVDYNYDADFVYSDTETSYEEECVGIWIPISSFLQKLKDEDIYDNSIIFIMADHGHNTPYNPLLLVKGINEKHPFTQSETRVAYKELPEAYVRLLTEKASGMTAFENYNMDERYCYGTEWNTHLYFDTYSANMIERKVIGKAYEENAVQKTGVVFEEKEVSGLNN